eukprot:scaffold86387_cov63-Phaeocystis_antarctica.AAC.2
MTSIRAPSRMLVRQPLIASPHSSIPSWGNKTGCRCPPRKARVKFGSDRVAAASPGWMRSPSRAL